MPDHEGVGASPHHPVPFLKEAAHLRDGAGGGDLHRGEVPGSPAWSNGCPAQPCNPDPGSQDQDGGAVPYLQRGRQDRQGLSRGGGGVGPL